MFIFQHFLIWLYSCLLWSESHWMSHLLIISKSDIHSHLFSLSTLMKVLVSYQATKILITEKILGKCWCWMNVEVWWPKMILALCILEPMTFLTDTITFPWWRWKLLESVESKHVGTKCRTDKNGTCCTSQINASIGFRCLFY